jgi:hypothetical protein
MRTIKERERNLSLLIKYMDYLLNGWLDLISGLKISQIKPLLRGPDCRLSKQSTISQGKSIPIHSSPFVPRPCFVTSNLGWILQRLQLTWS